MIKSILRNFCESDEQQISFPAYLDSKTKKSIESLSKNLNLNCRNVGAVPNRFIVVSKKSTIYEYTENDIELFVKDFSLPISVTKLPQFEYFVELFDEHFDTKNKYNYFKEAVNNAIQNNQTFTDLRKNILNKMVKYVQNISLIDDGINEEEGTFLVQMKNIYSVKNNSIEPKFYVSLDITKCNFNSIRIFQPHMLDNFNTWDEFVEKFTDLEYFKQSKFFRLLFFSRCRLKIWQKYQNVIMSNMFGKIRQNEPEIYQNGGDEMIIPSTEKEYIKKAKELQKIVNQHDEHKIWKVSAIKIYPIHPTNTFVREESNSGTGKTIKFKCCKDNTFPQIYKHYKGQECTKFDMMFSEDGLLKTFVNPVIPKNIAKMT